MQSLAAIPGFDFRGLGHTLQRRRAFECCDIFTIAPVFRIKPAVSRSRAAAGDARNGVSAIGIILQDQRRGARGPTNGV